MSLVLIFAMVSFVGFQAPALLDDSYDIYSASGRDGFCEDEYEDPDDEQGCINDSRCTPEYDGNEFDGCEDADESYCEQYEDDEYGCINDSRCSPEYEDDDDWMMGDKPTKIMRAKPVSNVNYNDDLDEDLDNIPFYGIDPEDDEDLEDDVHR